MNFLLETPVSIDAGSTSFSVVSIVAEVKERKVHAGWIHQRPNFRVVIGLKIMQMSLLRQIREIEERMIAGLPEVVLKRQPFKSNLNGDIFFHDLWISNEVMVSHFSFRV
jgi:hypothetical protein